MERGGASSSDVPPRGPLTEQPEAPGDDEPAPLARCEACAFAWYGPIAIDGLRILGRCIRCGGHVNFLIDVMPPDAEQIDPRLGPHQVLGDPWC